MGNSLDIPQTQFNKNFNNLSISKVKFNKVISGLVDS